MNLSSRAILMFHYISISSSLSFQALDWITQRKTSAPAEAQLQALSHVSYEWSSRQHVSNFCFVLTLEYGYLGPFLNFFPACWVSVVLYLDTHAFWLLTSNSLPAKSPQLSEGLVSVFQVLISYLVWKACHYPKVITTIKKRTTLNGLGAREFSPANDFNGKE